MKYWLTGITWSLWVPIVFWIGGLVFTKRSPKLGICSFLMLVSMMLVSILVFTALAQLSEIKKEK